MDRDDVKVLASEALEKIYEKYRASGLLSIYLWGSILTDDFNPSTSDIDAVGILSNEADFKEIDKIRDWLPTFEPRLNRLQINFFYLSELKGGPTRSRLARLYSANQAVFDLPNWQYVCGEHLDYENFPAVSPEQALRDQISLVSTKAQWVETGIYGDMGLQYFCKGLAWLCYNIHKLSHPPSPFAWEGLVAESTVETKELVNELISLKSKDWDPNDIKKKMPYLLETSQKLSAKYKT